MTVNASISDGSAVIYDTAHTNLGNGYDTTSGTFTAPVEGTYVFHFHALSHADEVGIASDMILMLQRSEDNSPYNLTMNFVYLMSTNQMLIQKIFDPILNAFLALTVIVYNFFGQRFCKRRFDWLS